MAQHVELVADNGDGTVRVAHGAHAGTIPVAVASGDAGLILTCPVCGASSYWPVTGGAEPAMADELAAVVADAAG